MIGDTSIYVKKMDITQSSCEAIVIASGSRLANHVHEAAGPQLRQACSVFEPVAAGDAKITPGYQLRAQFIIHVGVEFRPVDEEFNLYTQLFKKCFDLINHHRLKSVAFSHLIHELDDETNEELTIFAAETLRDCLMHTPDRLAEVDFVTEDENLYKIYKQALAYDLDGVG